ARLPGSRLTEVVRLGAPFAAAAAHLAARRPGFRFIAPMASPAVRELFVKQVAQVPDAPEIRLLDGEAQPALAACDAALVASGTATLEALLSARPMVVAYRVSPLTAFARRARERAWGAAGHERGGRRWRELSSRSPLPGSGAIAHASPASTRRVADRSRARWWRRR